jgi:hypothetical protein
LTHSGSEEIIQNPAPLRTLPAVKVKLVAHLGENFQNITRKAQSAPLYEDLERIDTLGGLP